MHVKLCNNCDVLIIRENANPPKFCSLKCRKKPKELLINKTRAGNSFCEYQSFRRKVLYRDKRICRHCGERGDFVHHIKSVSKYPEFELLVENGITLCCKCHREEHPDLSSGLFKPLSVLKENYLLYLSKIAS